jgi:hypothetical protein
MTFRDARDIVGEFGAKLSTFDSYEPSRRLLDRPDRLAVSCGVGEQALANAIEEANRYAGH